MALKERVASVFIKPYAVGLAVDILEGSETAIGTVAGFPQGCTPTDIKVHETHLYCARGATEIDMVVPIGKVLGDEEEPLPVTERLVGTLACHAWAALAGADILRVHDVGETVQLLAMLEAIATVERE